MGQKLNTLRNRLKKGFNPNQPRDAKGRWSDGGGISANFPLPKHEDRVFVAGGDGTKTYSSLESFRNAVKKVAEKQATPSPSPRKREYPESESSGFWDHKDISGLPPSEQVKHQAMMQKAAFKNAPPHLQKAYGKLLSEKQPELMQPDENKGAFFRATKSGQDWKVHFNGFGTSAKPSRSPEAFMRVYHHEMGHGIDWHMASPESLKNGKPFSVSLKPQFEADAAKLTRKKYLDGYKKVEEASNKIADQYVSDFESSKEYQKMSEPRRKERIEQIRTGVVQINLDMYDDIAGAMSLNKIGNGHNDEYWQRGDGMFRQMESAANIMSFMASGHKELTDAVRDLSPTFYNSLEEKIKKHG